MNLVHRVITSEEDAVDGEAATRLGYLRDRETGADGIGPARLDDAERRLIKSEVGARAVTDLMRWFEQHWAECVDFKAELIELLDASKFGTKEYTPYDVYIKALYEYFKEELGENSLELGRDAVDLADFQGDGVK